METGANRKRTRRLPADNLRSQVGCRAPAGVPNSAWPAPAGSPAGRSAILRKHAQPPHRASYQR
jgi:hypothetical protein